MDMQFFRDERVARAGRIIAIAVVVMVVLAVVVSIVDNRFEVNRFGMPGVSWMNGSTQQTNGMMGTGVVSPMAQYRSETSERSLKGIAANNDSAQTQDASVAVQDKKVIKTGDLILKVGSVDKAMEELRRIASQLEGDIFSSSVYDANTGNSIKQGTVTLKVPASRFDEALQNIKSIASVVVRETTNGQDVSSQYVDLQARLKNKQEEEQSIAAILTRDTNKITDVLEVTTELARVRGEIEQLQAQIKYLDNQSDMSTITVSFTEDAQIGKTDTKWRPSQEVKDAVNALIKAGQKAVSFLISFVIVLLPILIVLLVIFGGILYVIVKKLYQWLNQ